MRWCAHVLSCVAGVLLSLSAPANAQSSRCRESDRSRDHGSSAGRRRQDHRRNQRRRSWHSRFPRRVRRENGQAGLAVLDGSGAGRTRQRYVARRQLDAWRRATWLTGSYDPALKVLYWGTGNPGPDWNGDSRKGDNLYTCSLVALDVDTGRLRWHFQFTPHDVHDWDANQIPVLVDAEIEGRTRALVVNANRNGFFYALDRKNGEFILGTEYAKQTWAKGLDKKGRPILIPGMEPSEKGTLVYPSLQGSTNWSSPAYSPATNMLYVPVREMGSMYFTKSDVEYRPGAYYTGGSEKALAEEAWGAVRALDVTTGQQAWDFRLPSPPWAGVMATAGGLVFGGSNEGNFFALDAKTGKPLWQFQTGGSIRSGPVWFLAGGKQYISIAGGRGLFVFALDSP